MFGTVKPTLCGSGCGERSAYRQLYCGLCKAMGVTHGAAARAWVSYDAVGLALIAEAVSQGGVTETCRCPVAPWAHRSIVPPSRGSMQFAAHAQVLLGEQWAADRAEEGRLVGRVARAAIGGPAERARVGLARLGVGLDALREVAAEQAALEDAARWEDAAEPTAAALEVVFARVAELPETDPAARASGAALGAMGRAVGEAIYWIDALEDADADVRAGAFNPCVVGGRVDRARVAAVSDRLEQALAALDAETGRVAWQRHAGLVRKTFGDALSRRARRARRRAVRAAQVVIPWWWPRLLAGLWLWWATRGETEEGAEESRPRTVGQRWQQRKAQRRARRTQRRSANHEGALCCCEGCTDALCCFEVASCEGLGCAGAECLGGAACCEGAACCG